MGPEFYREDVTEKRWQLLQQLHRQYDFVLIGGWAVWAYTHQDKSRDIDIVVDYDTLGVLRQAFPNLHKNHRLKEYEIPQGVFDVDVYVPHYSTTLTVPPDYLLTQHLTQEGFRVPPPEALLGLKLGAWWERRDSIHGQQDLRDIRGWLPWCTLPAVRQLGLEAHLTTAQVERIAAAWQAAKPQIPKRLREAFERPKAARPRGAIR